MIDSSFISCHRNSKLSTRLVFLNKRKKKKKYRHALSNLVFKLFETPATLTHNVAQRWNIVNNCNNESVWKKKKKHNARERTRDASFRKTHPWFSDQMKRFVLL